MKKKRPKNLIPLLKAPEIEKLVGRRLRKRRLDCGLSQQALASKVGVSYQQIQKYETGVNRISVGRLWVVAKVLNEELAYFFKNGNEILEFNDVNRVKSRPIIFNPTFSDEEITKAIANLITALSKSNL